MSQYYTLLVNGKLDFEELLLEKYTLIGLDEAECILLIKLKKILKDNQHTNEVALIKSLHEEMTLSEKDLSEKILKLINSDYITLDEENEGFTLNGTFKRLSYLYDSEEENTNKEDNITDLKKCASLIEKECEHLLSPTELEVIKHWIEVDRFSFDEIKEATLNAVSHKKKSVKYIDVFLNKEKEKKISPSIGENDELSELFKSAIYGKK